MAPYFIRNLVPRREKRAEGRPLLQVLGTLTFIQWAHFFSGWLAWTCDAIDFFSVSLSISNLQTQFGKSTHEITTAITITLLLRSVGAVIFGVISDRFGRKWPLVINLVIIAVLELGAGFVQTFQQFLALRSLFGIAMGGIWGLAAATALENLPVEVRGLASGVVQQGYAVGYLIAAVINLFLVPSTSVGWRSLFYCAAGISSFAAVLRAILPESGFFLKAQEAERRRIAEGGAVVTNKTRQFLHETGEMLKAHWKLCIYAILLMTGFNFLSHGSQDLYPTYLKETKGFSADDATIATIIGNCGAISGGVIAGLVSQYIGRRLTIVIMVLLIACFIPLWILPSSFSGLAAGAFCMQFGVQGAWGVIPVLLAEISPPAFRATFPGVAYQLGNMISSASAQIEATGGDNLRTTIVNKKGETENVPDYATVQGILIGCVAAFVLFITIIGPENHGAHFEEARTAFEEGGGREEVAPEANATAAEGKEARIDEESGSSRNSVRVENEKQI